MELLLSILGGFFYRQRGGGYTFPVHLGTQGARIAFWALPTALLVGALTLDPWLSVAVFFASFAGLLFGHGGHQRSTAWMLTQEAITWDQSEFLTGWLWWFADYYDLAVWQKEIWHWVGASVINTIRLLLILIPIAIFTSSWWVLPCALIGIFPSYYIGWRTNITIPRFMQPKSTEVGEFLTGIAAWFAIILAVLLS